jgi:hypothetical protein
MNDQVKNYTVDMRSDEKFLELKDIDNLAKKLVEI